MSSLEDTPHFVWVRGTGNKPEPQKWCGLDLTYGYNRSILIASHPLSDEEWMQPLEELEKKYPCP